MCSSFINYAVYEPGYPYDQFGAEISNTGFVQNLHDQFNDNALLEYPSITQNDLMYSGDTFDHIWGKEYTPEEGVICENAGEFVSPPEQHAFSGYEGNNPYYPEHDNHSQYQQYRGLDGECFPALESAAYAVFNQCGESELMDHLIAQQNSQEMLVSQQILPTDAHRNAVEGRQTCIHPSQLMNYNGSTYSDLNFSPSRNSVNAQYSKSTEIPRSLHSSTSPSSTSSTSSTSNTGRRSSQGKGKRTRNTKSYSRLTLGMESEIEKSAAAKQRQWIAIIKEILSDSIQDGKQRAKLQRQQMRSSINLNNNNGATVNNNINNKGPYICPMPDCDEKYHPDAGQLARHWGCIHIAKSSELLPENDIRRLELIQLQRCTNFPKCTNILSRPDSLGRHLKRNACGTRAQEKIYDEGF